MPNIAIKQVGTDGAGEALYATTKVFLREKKVYPPLAPADVVEVSEEEAKHWLSTPLKNVLEITYDEPNRDSPPSFELIGEEGHINPEDRPALIRSAIRRVDREDKKLWTDSGKPTVSAVEKVIGFDITASERDRAWKALQENEAGAQREA